VSNPNDSLKDLCVPSSLSGVQQSDSLEQIDGAEIDIAESLFAKGITLCFDGISGLMGGEMGCWKLQAVAIISPTGFVDTISCEDNCSNEGIGFLLWGMWVTTTGFDLDNEFEFEFGFERLWMDVRSCDNWRRMDGCSLL
jgi:hypothetical protein